MPFRVCFLNTEINTVTQADALADVAGAFGRAVEDVILDETAREADCLVVVGQESHLDDALRELEDVPAEAQVVRVDEYDAYQFGSVLKALARRKLPGLLVSTRLAGRVTAEAADAVGQ
jgi:hypothetical protein